MALDKRVERLLERVRKNQKNCSFADLEALLLAVGFTERMAKGSHVFFKKGAHNLSVPKRHPIKEHYVKDALEIVAQVLDSG